MSSVSSTTTVPLDRCSTQPSTAAAAASVQAGAVQRGRPGRRPAGLRQFPRAATPQPPHRNRHSRQAFWAPRPAAPSWCRRAARYVGWCAQRGWRPSRTPAIPLTTSADSRLRRISTIAGLAASDTGDSTASPPRSRPRPPAAGGSSPERSPSQPSEPTSTPAQPRAPVRRPGTPAGAAGGRRRHAHPGGRSARRRAARRRPGTRWRAHRRRPRPRAASSPATRPGGQPCHRSGEHGKRTGRDQLAGRPLNADRSPNGFALDMRHPFGSSGGSRSGSVPAADPSNRKVAVSLTNLPGSCRVAAGSVLGFRGNVSGSLRRSREPMPERFDAWQELSERL
jgi:hypothetical protein